MGPESDPSEERLRRFVSEVWRLALGRAPGPEDLRRLVRELGAGGDPVGFLLGTLAGPEAEARRRAAEAVRLFVPPGHYYSPVVDPSSLDPVPGPGSGPVAGVPLDLDAMEALFHRLMEARADLRFPARRSEGFRYFHDNEMFSCGDAAVLCGMLRHLRPRRWIEVGSGFSSAALLDALDRTPGLETALTFVEPHPEHRLDALLRGADRERVRIVSTGVQGVPLDLFEALEAGDVLFLDTTHVAKTGSDVNYEVFGILPVLRPGVVIHFHDVFDGFEYPGHWVAEDNRSWNEAYLLRAFLRVCLESHAERPMRRSRSMTEAA